MTEGDDPGAFMSDYWHNFFGGLFQAVRRIQIIITYATVAYCIINWFKRKLSERRISNQRRIFNQRNMYDQFDMYDQSVLYDQRHMCYQRHRYYLSTLHASIKPETRSNCLLTF